MKYINTKTEFTNLKPVRIEYTMGGKKIQKEHFYAPAFSRNIYETLDHKKWSNISWKYRILKIRRLFQKIFRSIMALIVLRNGEFHETSPPASKLQRIFIRQHSELFSSCLELVLESLEKLMNLNIEKRSKNAMQNQESYFSMLCFSLK